MNLETYAENTWCKGCGNFGLLNSFRDAVNELAEGGMSLENIVISSGIGCHGKIVDYLNLNSFYSIHGRAIATISGMKIANPELIVIAFQGDGDAFGEGMAHIIFAAKRNIDATLIVHDNMVYGLTTGQFTPTSDKGFKGKSTPRGSIEDPVNPLALVLASGGTFVGRGFVGERRHLVDLLKKAILHKGFSFVDVLQPCVTFNNTYRHYRENTYILEEEGHDPADFQAAWDKARETEKVPIGVLYQTEKPTFDQLLLEGIVPAARRKPPLEAISEIISGR
ncbi:MAG: thiamine pyrophosphate-dependent enzyme [Thermoplasmata archaeon]